jgi:hypothetical protein
MSEFARKVYKAVGEYRTILRRQLSQADRMKRLEKLNLKVKLDGTSDLEFYHIAQNIVNDIRNAKAISGANYYSYHGTDHFADHLNTFINDYTVQGERVVHASQLGARAYLEAVQLTQVDEPHQNDDTAARLVRCNGLIAKFASDKELSDYYSVLKEACSGCADFFAPLMYHFKQELKAASRLFFDIDIVEAA